METCNIRDSSTIMSGVAPGYVSGTIVGKRPHGHQRSVELRLCVAESRTTNPLTRHTKKTKSPNFERRASSEL